MFKSLKKFFKKFINSFISEDEVIEFRPYGKWEDIGDWNDFENIGRTFDIKVIHNNKKNKK